MNLSGSVLANGWRSRPAQDKPKREPFPEMLELPKEVSGDEPL